MILMNLRTRNVTCANCVCILCEEAKANACWVKILLLGDIMAHHVYVFQVVLPSLILIPLGCVGTLVFLRMLANRLYYIHIILLDTFSQCPRNGQEDLIHHWSYTSGESRNWVCISVCPSVV